MKKIPFAAFAFCALLAGYACGDDDDEPDNTTDTPAKEESSEDSVKKFSLEIANRTVYFTNTREDIKKEEPYVYITGNNTISDLNTVTKCVKDRNGNTVIEGDEFTYIGNGYKFPAPKQEGAYYVSFIEQDGTETKSNEFRCYSPQKAISATITADKKYHSIRKNLSYAEEDAEQNADDIDFVCEAGVLVSPSECENETIKSKGMKTTFDGKTKTSNAGATCYFQLNDGQNGLIHIASIEIDSKTAKWKNITVIYKILD